MATGPTQYNGGYVPPPAVADAQWIAQMRAANIPLPKDPGVIAKLRALFSNEQGSTNLFTPGGVAGERQSLGTVQDMVRARLEAAAARAQAGQQIAQTQAVLRNGGSAADMAGMRAQLGATPGSLGNTGTNPLAGILEGTPQGQAMAQLQGQVGGNPLGVPGSPQMGAPLQVGPRALPSGPPIIEPNAVPSSGQTFTAGSQGVSDPASNIRFSSSQELVPYTGGAGAAGGGAGEAAATAGRWGRFTDWLKSDLPSSNPVPGIMGEAGPKAALADAGGIMQVAKGMGARGLSVGLPVYMGTQIAAKPLGAAIQAALPLTPGAGAAGGDALANMGKGFAAGYTVGGPIGGVVGEVAGGVQTAAPLASELIGDLNGDGKAQQWGKATDEFNKLITKTSKFDRKSRDYFNMQYYDTAQQIKDGAEAGTIPHDKAIAAMNQLNTAMKSDYLQMRDTQPKPKHDAAQALKFGNAMATMMQPYTDTSIQASDMLRAIEPQVPESARPILEAQANMNSAYARQMQGAYVGAGAMIPTMSRMDAQLAQYNQLLQRIQAAQSSSSGGQSLAGSLAANQGNQQPSSAQAAGLTG